MVNNEKIIDKIAEKILAYVQKAIEKAPFDRSFRAQVTQVLGNGKYKILYRGAEYTAKCSFDVAINTWVTVCALQNDFKNLYIIYT